MKIPKQLQVGRKLYKVLVVRSMSSKFLRGIAEFQEKRIQIARNRSDMQRRYTPVEQEDTFWHELTHTILYDMEHPYCFNEKFVDAFSRRLSRAVRTAKF